MYIKCKTGIKELKKMCRNAEGPDLLVILKANSMAVVGLYKWANATVNYYEIYRQVEPMKKAIAEMERAQETSLNLS